MSGKLFITMGQKAKNSIENIDLRRQEKQVVSRRRVADHGEVYTAQREVNAMLDLVKQETERIESRFLEPACGSGNFLTEVLSRKLKIVENRYSKSQLEYEWYVVIAASSIYGIDLLKDNVIECRKRLFDIFNKKYIYLYKDAAKEECRNSVRYIFEKNIIWGDALTLNTVGEIPQHIVFCEWSPFNGNMIKRRDFTFRTLLSHGETKGLPLFSDLGEEAFIPEPVKEYPPINFLRIADVEQK